MPKLPCVSGQKVARALERLGFERRRQRGSHLVMRRGSDVCVVPMHREVDQGTLRGVLRQAGVSEEEFRGVLQH
jgi:predicted RNA binding protein YcfA (HicA-like mRNA interferase family)